MANWSSSNFLYRFVMYIFVFIIYIGTPFVYCYSDDNGVIELLPSKNDWTEHQEYSMRTNLASQGYIFSQKIIFFSPLPFQTNWWKIYLFPPSSIISCPNRIFLLFSNFFPGLLTLNFHCHLIHLRSFPNSIFH